jgi:hypothetical protein
MFMEGLEGLEGKSHIAPIARPSKDVYRGVSLPTLPVLPYLPFDMDSIPCEHRVYDDEKNGSADVCKGLSRTRAPARQQGQL